MDAIKQFDEKLTADERALMDGLDSPFRIQEFLDGITYPSGEENRSPVDVLRLRRAHCLDGGLFAAAALRRVGYPPLILDMQPDPGRDDDHVLTIYREFDCWGAVAKSNYSGLRFREPVYQTIRELVLSYFDDFFNIKREKTLRYYTEPINLEIFDEKNWLTEASGVDEVEAYLKQVDVVQLISPEQANYLSPVDSRSFKAGTLGINLEGAYNPE